MEKTSFKSLHKNRILFIEKNKNKDHAIISGINNFLISAPHGVSQVRLGKLKHSEIGSLTTALQLQKDNDCYLIAKTKNNSDDIYQLEKRLPKSYKQSIPELYHQIKRLLISSKIENQSINDYIKITQGFLEGIFDSVLPQRKNVLYTKNGAIVKRQPESIVLNTVL